MGETLLLLSCGAAFITGLVIAAASLFGSGVVATLTQLGRPNTGSRDGLA
jgi:hypothetical protein